MYMLNSVSNLILCAKARLFSKIKMNTFSLKTCPKVHLLYGLMYLHFSIQDCIDIYRFIFFFSGEGEGSFSNSG